MRHNTRQLLLVIVVGVLVIGAAFQMLAASSSSRSAENKVAPIATLSFGAPADTASSNATDEHRCPSETAYVAAAENVHLGCETGLYDEPHAVTIAAFCMDKTEMTVSRYSVCVEAGVCSPPGCAQLGTNFPVVCISAADAEAACTFEGKRLPTTDEWEYAARGASGRNNPWADNADLDEEDSAFDEILPVGRRKLDVCPVGIHDLALNAWEWTASPEGTLALQLPFADEGGARPKADVAADAGPLRPQKQMVMTRSFIHLSRSHSIGCSFIPVDKALRTQHLLGARCAMASNEGDR